MESWWKLRGEAMVPGLGQQWMVKTWSDPEPLLRGEPTVFADRWERQRGKVRGVKNDS